MEVCRLTPDGAPMLTYILSETRRKDGTFPVLTGRWRGSLHLMMRRDEDGVERDSTSVFLFYDTLVAYWWSRVATKPHSGAQLNLSSLPSSFPSPFPGPVALYTRLYIVKCLIRFYNTRTTSHSKFFVDASFA